MSVRSFYDVVVAGGGPAGYPAAIQAARMGARVLLLEKSGQLGGTTTLNQVAFPGLFHAWGRQIIAGIGWDLVCRAVELEGASLPDFSDLNTRHWQHQIRLCPALFSALIDEEVRQSGCDFLLHVMPACIAPREGGGWTLRLCGKEGLFGLECSWLIDATGDANAARLAGCPLAPRPAELQPATLAFCLEGYEPDDLDLDALEQATGKALDDGLLRRSDLGWSGQSIVPLLRSRGKNTVHIPHVDAVDSAGKTVAEVRGRASLLRVYRFLKAQPGLESLRIGWCAAECGIRETRSIIGRSKVTEADYTSGKKWPDAVCHSFYPIDLHTEEGLKCAALKPGTIPTIPLSAMIPEGMPGFLAAGRCISGDRLANSAFRVQASCMAMGQAAGAAAALAARENIGDAAQVSFGSLRAALEKEGAIVPS